VSSVVFYPHALGSLARARFDPVQLFGLLHGVLRIVHMLLEFFVRKSLRMHQKNSVSVDV
jgi:hypothetical protein